MSQNRKDKHMRVSGMVPSKRENILEVRAWALETGLAWSSRKGIVEEKMEREPTPPTHLGLFITGEVKKGKVTGFHNWIRFYLQEKEGLLDYYSHNYDGPVSTWAGGAWVVPGLPALPLPSKQSDLLLALALTTSQQGIGTSRPHLLESRFLPQYQQ